MLRLRSPPVEPGPTVETCDPKALAELLLQVDRPAAELATELARARRACIGDATLAAELDELELRFLRRQAERPSADEPTRKAVAAARIGMLRARIDALLGATPAPALLFDLAEIEAEAQHLGELELAARAREGRLRMQTQVPRDAALCEEARERYAVLASHEQELTPQHRILQLTTVAGLLEDLVRLGAGKPLPSLARRLRARAQDLGLERELTARLGANGVRRLENTSFLLLAVLFVLLFADALLPLSLGTRRTLMLIDGAICVFFILEFAFKFALAPERRQWFVRNALFDLLPALPAALLLLDVGLEAGDEAAGLRALRFLRIAWFARYVQALRPLLQMLRLVLFLVRGFDRLVQRFAPLLNRNFVFFERDPTALGAAVPGGASPQRALVFQALRREHLLLEELPPAERNALLAERGRELASRVHAVPPGTAAMRTFERDVAVETAIVQLHALQTEDIAVWLSRRDLASLDRVVRVMSAPFVRSLPFVRRLAVHPLPDAPEERIVQLGRRVARLLEQWRERTLYFADLHGILTGPQILDRIATAIVVATSRPAVRLLIFGSLFALVWLLLGENHFLGRFLKNFVATPLLVLGGVCLVLLTLGRWLRRIAGEASDSLHRTSEAHFQSLVELRKLRHEEQDLQFLVRRVFPVELPVAQAAAALRRRIARQRGRTAPPSESEPPSLQSQLDRLALLYLHGLDGALLHQGDITTSQQLLANLSLENIRTLYLRYDRRERKRLARLALDVGRLRSGPFLWFQFIAESVATEAAKRVLEYNRNCLTRAERERATPQRVQAFEAWINSRLGQEYGRTLAPVRTTDGCYATTEFTALDFLNVDEERERRVEQLFGPRVLAAMRHDRRAMAREIFGMRPLDRLPRSRRTVNFYLLHRKHFAGGRSLLIPLWLAWQTVRGVWVGVRRLVRIVEEILTPRLAAARAVRGEASFAVARRKIHRMKGQGLLEAMRMRAAFDPEYCGVPATWSDAQTVDAISELERDLDFLGMAAHERTDLHQIAAATKELVLDWHARVATLPPLVTERDPVVRRQAESAATIAWLTDLQQTRTLLQATAWRDELVALVETDCEAWSWQPVRRCLRWLLRGCRRHPARAWLAAHPGDGPAFRSRRARRRLCRAYDLDVLQTRRFVDAWAALPAGTDPVTAALARLRAVAEDPLPIARDLTALRAVQSLSVLDVRNYRELVFEIGAYAADGEDPAQATQLP